MPNNYPVRNLHSSLMPQDHHNIRLLRLVHLPVTHEMVSYIAWLSHSIVCDGDYSLSTSPESPEVPDLEDFVTYVCYRSNVYTATLLSVIIYLERLRARMPAMASGAPGTPHRLFLASLIVAAKYLNDCSPKNVHWMSCANQLFDLREINLMEKQMLFLLDFKLSFTEKDALKDWAPLLEVHQDAVESIDGYDHALKSRTKLSAPDNFVVKVSNSLSAELIAEEKARDRQTREKAMQLVARGARQRMEKSGSEVSIPHSEPAATVVKAKAARSYQVPLKACISTPPSLSSSRSSVVSSAVKHTEEPPSCTNVHMRTTVLGNILTRGSSTDSVTSSLLSSTSSLTEDAGTSSSSAASSFDEEDNYPDVVRVQPSLRIEDEIASLERSMEELAGQMAGLAGIGTIVGQKERYGELNMRPVRQLQSVTRPTVSNQKKLRFSMSRRRSATVAILSPQSSDDKATDDFLSSDCPRHAQPPFASSSSTITAPSRGLSGSSNRHRTPGVPTSTPVTGSTPSVQRQPRRTTGRFFTHKSASSNTLSTAPLSLSGPRQTVLPSQMACSNSLSAPSKRMERNTTRVVHAPKPMGFGASLRNFLGAVTSVSSVSGSLGSIAQGSSNPDASFDLPPLGRGRSALKAEY